MHLQIEFQCANAKHLGGGIEPSRNRSETRWTSHTSAKPPRQLNSLKAWIFKGEFGDLDGLRDLPLLQLWMRGGVPSYLWISFMFWSFWSFGAPGAAAIFSNYCVRVMFSPSRTLLKQFSFYALLQMEKIRACVSKKSQLSRCYLENLERFSVKFLVKIGSNFRSVEVFFGQVGISFS